MTTRNDLLIRQGETWSWTYTKRDGAGAAVNLTGYTARMAIKVSYSGGAQAYLSSGSDANGGTITLGGALGTVTLAMTATQSATLAGAVWGWHWMDEAGLTGETRATPHEPTVTYLYDLELVSAAGSVTRELEGRCVVHRQITT